MASGFRKQLASFLECFSCVGGCTALLRNRCDPLEFVLICVIYVDLLQGAAFDFLND